MSARDVKWAEITFRAVMPTQLPEVTATTWRLPLALDRPMLWAPPDRTVLLRAMEGPTISAVLQVQSLGPPGTAGFHSGEIPITLGRIP